MKLSSNDHAFRLVFLGVVITLLYVGILIPAGFFESARLRSFDSLCRWRNHWFSSPAQTEDLLLVTIDEESQRQLGKKWPWERALFGDFLRQVDRHQPSVVVLDLVLSGASQTASDQALAQAIQKNRAPVVLANYLDRQGDPVYPYALFTEAGGISGLINKPRDPDLTIRRLFPGIRIPMHDMPLYATELLASALHRGISLQEIKLGRDLRQIQIGNQAIPLQPPVGTLQINYWLDLHRVASVSFWKALRGDIDPTLIKNKVVLVGSAQEITHDVYPTPLGVLPGVLISANGILTLLSGQFLHPLRLVFTFPAAWLFVTTLLLLTHRLSLPASLLAFSGILGTGVFSALAAMVFLHWQTETFSVVLLGGAAWLTAMTYKYLLLVWESLRLHHQVVTHPLTHIYTARYFHLRLDKALSQRGGWRRQDGLLVVQSDSFSELMHRISLKEAGEKIRSLVSRLRRLHKNGIVGHVTDHRYGVYLPGLGQTGVSELGRQIQELFKDYQGHLGCGLALSGNRLKGASELLAAAESACGKSWAASGRLVIHDPKTDASVSAPAPGSPTEAQPLSMEFDDVASELEQRNQILEKTLEELRGAHQELQSHFLDVTKSLVMAMDTKDAYTAGHLERVSRYAARLAETLQRPTEEIHAIREAALLHDIGKLNLPDEILHKIGPLTAEEVEIIKKHLELGAKILDPMKFFRPITTILYHHHERYDGKGYPHGLAGEFIPSGAQVISVVDAFDAMTTHRGYNKPKTVQEAMEELRRGAGSQFNPEYVEVFIRLIQSEGPHLSGYNTAA